MKKIVIILFLFCLGTVASAQELTFPLNFKYQTINNLGEFSETTYRDVNLSKFDRYQEYSIKLYSDYNVTANDQAPHVGVLVKINNKATTLFQIQNSYIGHNVKIAIYDRSNKLIGISENKSVGGNEILNVDLAITTFENAGYRFVYDERDGQFVLDKANTNEIECYIGNESNATIDKFCDIRKNSDPSFNRVGETTVSRERLTVPSGDYFITIVTSQGEKIVFPTFHLAPKKPLLLQKPYLPYYVAIDSIIVSVQGEAGTTIMLNGTEVGIMPQSNEANVTIDTSGVRGNKTLLFSLKDSMGKISVNNQSEYHKISNIKSLVLEKDITMLIGETISTNGSDINMTVYGFDYELKLKVTYLNNVSEFLDINRIELDITNPNIFERRAKVLTQKAYYIYALKEGNTTIRAKIQTLSSNEIKIKVMPLDTDGDGIPDNQDLDDDNDGISDIDELKYGFNPLDKNDANQDFDGDGFSNIDEIKAGTNPKDKNDYPSKGMTKKIQTLFMIIANRSNRLNSVDSSDTTTPSISFSTVLLMEAIRRAK